ncbi:hypothetical protein F2Q68_00044059 [Brassica cretica]|uniref:Uncharacterized protein n=1 Tax=Brassica cretica TaxID=69181 RepID=A0A8S9LS12_BRACR|nr:hypothetical protein F2Q68_00044059 [Brassica cretica]
MSKSEAMNKKKDYCEEERCRNEEEESAMKKKRDGAKKSEVMAKKMKLNSSVHGGPRQTQSGSKPREGNHIFIYYPRWQIVGPIKASAVAEPAGSSSSSEVPIENQGPCSDSGSEYGEPELRSSDPQGVDAEKLVVLTDEPLREASPETDVNPKSMYWLHLQLQRKWWRMVRKYNVEKWGQELQNSQNILP